MTTRGNISYLLPLERAATASILWRAFTWATGMPVMCIQLLVGKLVSMSSSSWSIVQVRLHGKMGAMRSTLGDGAPQVFNTGRHGRYYSMVMELLGAALQRLVESRPTKRLPWDIVAIIVYKCV